MEIPEGFEIVDVPLYEVRHKGPGTIKTFPDGRIIEFFEAEDDQYVISYNDQGNPEWKPIRGFSVHDGCEIVIINLSNGLQIISDHDPRAVVGVEPGTDSIELQRYYPDEAMEKGVLVPCSWLNLWQSWNTDYGYAFENLWDAVADKARLFRENALNSRISFDKDNGIWVVKNHEYTHPEPMGGKFTKGFKWSSIESVTHTGKVEPGYDLTVPGYETFMSADGIILSNTMNVSLPSLPESVEEAKNVLMPSKMLLSINKPDTIMPALKHEQILGLYTAKNVPAEKSHKFKTDDEAMDAIKRGDVKYSDELQIG